MILPGFAGTTRHSHYRESDVGSSSQGSPIKGAHGLTIGHVAHDCELGRSRGSLLGFEADLSVHGRGKWLRPSRLNRRKIESM